MKRLGIFFFYEKNGDVDDFITYYLRDLARNLTELIVVCNGKLSKQGRAAFEEFTDLSCFLFIAGNGCGDYYGYRIEDRTVLPSPIYIWEHETFKAKVVANNLIEMIELYYRDKI